MPVKFKSSLFRDLLYLQEVIVHRQISGAAAKNGIKASNLSKIIKSMEELAGKELFFRNTHGLIPTNEALKISELISGLEKHFDEINRTICGKSVYGELKLYLPANFQLKNSRPFLQKHNLNSLTICNQEKDADVIVSYNPPANSAHLTVVENTIGNSFSQTIWVSAVNNEKSLALAQFIINQLHDS